jgi:hypothetical protein
MDEIEKKMFCDQLINSGRAHSANISDEKYGYNDDINSN